MSCFRLENGLREAGIDFKFNKVPADVVESEDDEIYTLVSFLEPDVFHFFLCVYWTSF